MKHQKLPTDLTVEELLKALNQSIVTDEKDQEVNSNLIPMPKYEGQFIESNPVLSFIEAFKLRPGNHLVASHIIYDLFKTWNKLTKVPKISFSAEFNKYFRIQRSYNKNNDVVFYALNERGATLAYYMDQYKKTNKRKHLTSKNHRKHYEKFFNDTGIEPGPLFIEADVLYHVYDTYMYKNKRKSHAYLRFELICGLFFEEKYFDGTNTPWFGVSENIKQLISPQAVANWREGRKRFNDNKFKKPIKEEDKDKIIYPETIEEKKE